MDPDEQIWAEKCFRVKVAFFQKNQVGIGPLAQIGGNGSKIGF